MMIETMKRTNKFANKCSILITSDEHTAKLIIKYPKQINWNRTEAQTKST